LLSTLVQPRLNLPRYV